MILGVTGTYCSGKDTVADLLKEQCFVHISLSSIIREEAAKKGTEPTRDNLIALGNELREKHGAGVLAKIGISQMNSEDNYVVTSIRNPGEVSTLRETNQFYLIAVDAPQEIRFKRMQNRAKRQDDIKTIDDFKRYEQGELESSNPAGQQLKAVINMADSVIENTSPLQYLKDAVSKIVESFLSKENKQ